MVYWDKHYGPIIDFARFIFDITKYDHRKNICHRCFESFYNEESLAKHERLCTNEDFMSVLHVHPAPKTEQAHIKFRQFRNTYIAPFVVYADFKSILKPIERRDKNTFYEQHHKISAACAILVSTIKEVPTRTLHSINENALSEFLNTLIDWERQCIDYLKNNISMQRLSRAKQEQYDNTIHCHFCRKPFQGDEDPYGPKVRAHDNFTGHFIGASHSHCNPQQRVNY